MNENIKNLIKLSLNSFIAYILSYLILFVPSQFVSFLAAKTYYIPIGFNHFKLVFQAADYSSLWTQSSVVSVYLSVPVFVFVFGIFFRFLYSYLSTNRRSLNLLLIWSFTHCMNIFFGGLIVGIPLEKGFGYVPIWLYLPEFALIGLIVVSIFILFLNSYFLRRAFVSLTFSEYYLKNHSTLLAYKIAVVLLPSILANAIFYIIKFPDNSLYETLLLLTIFIQVIGIIPYNYRYFEIKDENRNVIFSRKSLTWLLGLIVMLILLRVLYNI
jgi:hypothetical protein